MEPDGPEVQQFLLQLYTEISGDTDAQASIYDIGKALGIGKDDSEMLAQSLYIQGFAELKTLSGGIGITPEGLEALNVGTGGENIVRLGNSRVLGESEIKAVTEVMAEIRESVSGSAGPFDQQEEMVIDLKTIEVQLLSPKPKTAVIREVLRSLGRAAENTGPGSLCDKLKAMISN